jgi:hypothetical protein
VKVGAGDPSAVITPTSTHTLGEPQVTGPLAVFPVHGPEPQLRYRTLAEAIELGALARERDGGASVRSLVVENPTDLPLLVLEGEEVLGAQQNRTFDESALIAAGESAMLAVSCVEAGRWDGRRHAERMRPSPQAADPALRRVKRLSAAATGLADQHEVWNEVEERLHRHSVRSPSAAMSDVYDGRRGELSELSGAVVHRAGQTGALALVAGRPAALDLVSRPDAFASLLPRLCQGYALGALGAPAAEPEPNAAAAFLSAALGTSRVAGPGTGLGRSVAVAAAGLVGAGVEHDGELIALCAYPA